MSCRKVAVLISVLLVILAVCFAAPADKEKAVVAESKAEPLAEEKDDLKPAASHYGGWGSGYGGWGGHYGGWGGHYGGFGGGYYPYYSSWGWPSYSYGHGYGFPYGYGYGHHGYWW